MIYLEGHASSVQHTREHLSRTADQDSGFSPGGYTRHRCTFVLDRYRIEVDQFGRPIGIREDDEIAVAGKPDVRRETFKVYAYKNLTADEHGVRFEWAWFLVALFGITAAMFLLNLGASSPDDWPDVARFVLIGFTVLFGLIAIAGAVKAAKGFAARRLINQRSQRSG
jgi:hypothetical protein